MKNKNTEDITRKDALQKIGSYGKYAAFIALGTYMVLSPEKTQAQSPVPPGGMF